MDPKCRNRQNTFENIEKGDPVIIKTNQAHWNLIRVETVLYGVVKGIPDTGDIKGIEGWILNENHEVSSIRQMGRGTTYLVNFNTCLLPNIIYTPFGKRPVYTYMRSTSQCRVCLAFGHTLSSCQTKIKICNKCGNPGHIRENCLNNTLKCIHCKSTEHGFADKSCPVIQDRRKIVQKVQKHEAWVKSRQRLNSAGQTWALIR